MTSENPERYPRFRPPEAEQPKKAYFVVNGKAFFVELDPGQEAVIGLARIRLPATETAKESQVFAHLKPRFSGTRIEIVALGRRERKAVTQNLEAQEATMQDDLPEKVLEQLVQERIDASMHQPRKWWQPLLRLLLKIK